MTPNFLDVLAQHWGKTTKRQHEVIEELSETVRELRDEIEKIREELRRTQPIIIQQPSQIVIREVPVIHQIPHITVATPEPQPFATWYQTTASDTAPSRDATNCLRLMVSDDDDDYRQVS